VASGRRPTRRSCSTATASRTSSAGTSEISEDDTDTTEAPTRRDTIKYGGAIVGGGLLAGCSSQSDGGSTSTETSAEETSTPTETEDTSYSVEMAPMGRVSFEAVPESWVPYGGDYADMGVALGHGDGLTRVGNVSE
jgi:iron complex transport system substrate-binding protein